MYLNLRRTDRMLSGSERESTCAALNLNGVKVICDPSGALFVPDHRLLVVSDLHLEKGAAFARRGQMLPPYDTLATLKILSHIINHYSPDLVVSLGDNFHDPKGSILLSDEMRVSLNEIVGSRQWIWINGNHDPDGTHGLLGVSVDKFQMAGLTFRHEPSSAHVLGEIAGHLHPCASVRRYGQVVKSACFASDGRRLLMPAFGTMSGGLDMRHKAFRGLFNTEALVTYILGKERIYPVRFDRLIS